MKSNQNNMASFDNSYNYSRFWPTEGNDQFNTSQPEYAGALSQQLNESQAAGYDVRSF